ncbi:hypothetical protein HRbin01_00510 [archaeon HR01]|nr:hypothetical protein HRbin01_00510 [archaeon HR01]
MSLRLTDLYPVWLVDLGAVITLLIIALGIAYRIVQLRRAGVFTLLRLSARQIGVSGLLVTSVKEIFSRVALSRDVISGSRWRWAAHYSQFAGFILCAIATTLVYIYYPTAEPREFTSVPKIVGNLGGILLILGGIYFLRKIANRGRGLADVAFTSMLFTAAVTGFATQFSRVSEEATLTFLFYTIHLLSVAVLLATAPLTKFFHAVQTPFLRLVERLSTSAMMKQGALAAGSRALKEDILLESVLRKYSYE